LLVGLLKHIGLIPTHEMLTASIQPPAKNLFRSFWWAGYECTDQLNTFGNRVDFLTLTGHLDRLDDDYRDLGTFQIQTVREGLRWSQVETRAYQYDWRVVRHMLQRGRALGIQQIWDICHFGYPDDLTPLHPMFARRFAAICRAFVAVYRETYPDEPLIVTPINEVSFMSWLGGEVRGTVPYCTKQGVEVKMGLMRAYIEGVRAMREQDANVLIMSTEPLVNMVPPLNATRRQHAAAKAAHEAQYQATDILTGRQHPELGGAPDLLDVVGLNYYFSNQWEFPSYTSLPWGNEANDPRYRPLYTLLREVYKRYGKPIALTETSHPGIDRPAWIRMVARECALARQAGVPLQGICLYPIIDRPDWDHLTPWHRSGLWDARPIGQDMITGNVPERHLYQPYAEALREAQAVVSPCRP
jgi:beta-glucosidase/6-phospho-beta-glucosidase/beta-galactosidase